MSISLGLVHQDRAEQKQSTATANLKGLREEESPNSGSPQDRSLNPVATGTGSITSHTTTSPAPAPVPAPATPSPTSPTPKPTLPRKKSLSIMSMSMSAFTSTASSSSTRSSNPSIKSKSSESSSSKPPPPPRPRSPPSMYHMYAMDAPRAPKPLVKLPSKSSKEGKEGKGKADNHNGSTSTLGTISSFGSHRSSKDKDKGKGTGTGLPSIIPAKFGFRRTSSVGRMQAPTPIQNQNQNDHHHQSTAQPSPPPPPTESGTPLSPAFPVQSEEEIRKKRIERVERTFGEHVPQELVFPGPGGDIPQQQHQHQHQERLWRELDLNAKDLDRVYRAKQEGKAVRRASISVATFASLRKRAAGSIASTRTHSRGSSGTSDSHDHEFVPTSHSEIMEERRGPAVPSKTGTTNSVPRPRPLPPVPTGAAASGPRASNDHPHPEPKLYQDSPRTEPVRFQPRQSSLIARTKSLSSHPSLPFAIDASLSLPRPSSPFVDNLVPIPRSQSRNGTGNGLLVPPGMELVEGTVVRRERKQGWSGEWNRDDMQDVIQKLRALK